MKNLKLVLIISFIVMTGCISNPTKQALSVVVAGTNIAYEFDNGIEAKFLDQVQLTDSENKIVADSLAQLESSKLKLKQYANNPMKLVSMIVDTRVEAILVKQAYRDIYVVVNHNFDKYPKSTQLKFESFHESAVVLNEQFENLGDSVDSNKNIGIILNIAETALKLAVLL